MEYQDLVGLSKEIVDYQLLFAYFIFGVATVSVFVFPAIQLFQNPKKALTAIAGVAGLALIYFLFFTLAKAEPYTISTGTGDTTTIAAGAMKFVEANLYMTYAVFLFSVLAIVYSTVSNYFK